MVTVVSLTDIKAGDVIYSTKHIVPFFIGKSIGNYWYDKNFTSDHPKNQDLYVEHDHRRAIEVRVPIIVVETYGDFYLRGRKLYKVLAPWGTMGYIELTPGKREGEHSFTIERLGK